MSSITRLPNLEYLPSRSARLLYEMVQGTIKVPAEHPFIPYLYPFDWILPLLTSSLFITPIQLAMFVLFISLFTVAVWRMVTRDALRAVPGPTFASWSDLWLTVHARLGRRYLAVHAAHQTYGPVVRIAPNHVSLADKDAIAIVFGQGSKAMAKSSFYDAFIGGSPSVFSTRDRSEHARKRKGYSKTFAATSVKDYTPQIQDCLQELIRQFDGFCERPDKSKDVSAAPDVDILRWLNYFAFDVLSDLAFGDRLGMLKQGSDLISLSQSKEAPEDGCISLVDQREHLAAVLGLSPSLRLLANWIPDPFFQRGKRCADGLVDVARACITRRLQSGIERDDILGKLLASRGETVHDHEELTSEAVTLLIAGSDTTSNSITAALHLILTHPRVHAKLLQELESAFGVCGKPTSCDDCSNLPYLQDVINESLRVFAPTAIGLPRTVPPEGIYCYGYWFPGGTELSVPSWTIQHDPSIWGNDVDDFRPERWSQDQTLVRYLMTFGFGPRACLGRNLAYLEMKMVLATLILRYDFSLRSNKLESTEGFMHKPRDLWVRLRRRCDIDQK